MEATSSLRNRVSALVRRVSGAEGRIGGAAALGAATKAGEAAVEHHGKVLKRSKQPSNSSNDSAPFAGAPDDVVGMGRPRVGHGWRRQASMRGWAAEY